MATEEKDLVKRVAYLLKVEVFQVFYLAAQDEGLGHPHEIAAHRSQEYTTRGYDNVPQYVKDFCETMSRALVRIEHTA